MEGVRSGSPNLADRPERTCEKGRRTCQSLSCRHHRSCLKVRAIPRVRVIFRGGLFCCPFSATLSFVTILRFGKLTLSFSHQQWTWLQKTQLTAFTCSLTSPIPTSAWFFEEAVVPVLFVAHAPCAHWSSGHFELWSSRIRHSTTTAALAAIHSRTVLARFPG